MQFHGLFIGIDRYQSSRISWLGCAVRDAKSLHALFADNLGGKTQLLTDEKATREEILKQLSGLATCAEDDVVVISFSGHGSDTHELVTYDAEIDRLFETAIPLEELTKCFEAIPAKRLIFILDCCFSGGMGSKVLHAPALKRDLASEEAVLKRLSGEGRLIITASTAQQPAWETQKHGHGLLTHFILEALQGAEEARQGGNISIMKLVEYVTQRVSAEATQFGTPQDPTIRGQIDGQFTWPIFTMGPCFRSAFPEYTEAAATADLNSLQALGFPSEIIQSWSNSIPSLNQLQIDAVNDFNLLRGEHLVISAPTSSGKTMIGELAAVHSALERKRAVFLLPLKAIVNDKYRYFNKTYGSFGMRIIRATGDVSDDIPTLMRGQYDICLLTYEKFAALLLANSHILHGIGTVVVDEVQMIADKSRGLNLEFLLTLMRMRRQEGIEPQVIALSAVIGDTNGFERWLSARLLRRNERPVPLNEGIVRSDGSYRYIAPDGTEKSGALIRPEYRKGSSQDYIVPLVRKLVAEGKQVIVFRETKGEARGCANYLAESLNLPSATEAFNALSSADPSLASEGLRACLRGGVAFHVSDLDPEERGIVEEQFRKPGSTIRVIAATTTLAMGVNTPAESVVIAGLEHPGNQAYSVAEYKNMVGRAGRLGFSTEGSSYLIALNTKDEHLYWGGYVSASPEDLESRFVASDDPRSIMLRILAAAQKSTHEGVAFEDVLSFLEGSYGVFRYTQKHGSSPWSHEQLRTALISLREHGLVEAGDEAHYSLTTLGRFAGEGGVDVESVIRLVDIFKGMNPETITDPTLIAAAQVTTEVDSVYFPMNKKSTQAEPQAWIGELRNQGVAQGALNALNRNSNELHQNTLRAKKAVACLLWITEKPLLEVEKILTRFGGAFGGAAGPIRGATSRTRDMLPTVAKVVQHLHPDLDISRRCRSLLIRLEIGVPGAAVDLAAYAGSQLTRGDYQKLLKMNLCTIVAATAASDAELLNCLGGDSNKVAAIRAAIEAHAKQEGDVEVELMLAPYKA